MQNQQFNTHDWYDSPLYYDIIFSADTPLECQFMHDVMALHAPGVPLRKVLEPACGSGRLVLGMAQRGCKVVGFDINEAMLTFGRERLAQEAPTVAAKLVQGRMEDFDLGKNYDLAHCLVSTFKYLLQETEARAHLACVARALRSGGLYVLGFHLSDYDDPSRSRERWFGKRDNTEVICNIQSWPPDRKSRLEQVRSRLTVRQGRKRSKLETHWTFRAYNAAQVRRLLQTVPELEHVATYDFTYDLKKPRKFDDNQLDNVLILRKR